MARLDNPAGRLHALLSEYRAAAFTGHSIRRTWAAVLGVDQSDVAVALTEVASLVPAIQAAVSRSGDEDQQEVVDTYVRHWASPITTPDYPTGANPSPGPALVDPGALAALGGLSAYLSLRRSEGTIPGDESLQNLTAMVRDAIDELAAADDLPADAREMILDRLQDVAEALARLRIVGPGAVLAGTERAAFAASMLTPEQQQRPAVQKAMAAARTLWVAFTSTPAAQRSLEASHAIFGMLTSGGS